MRAWPIPATARFMTVPTRRLPRPAASRRGRAPRWRRRTSTTSIPNSAKAVESLDGAGAGAGRRRNRQDPGPDHPHRPYPQPRPGPAGRNPRRHLHQQGGARDEAARRRHGRPDCRGHAVAWHLPFDRRQDPAPARRTGRAEAGFHHSRHRRPDPAAEAAAAGRGHRRKALAGAGVGRTDRQLEEPRPDPDQVPAGEAAASPAARARSSMPPTRSG